MPVTDYSLPIDRELKPGMVPTLENVTIRAFVNSTTDMIPAGMFVVQGDEEDDAMLPDGTNRRILGVAYYSDTFERREGYTINSDGYYSYPAKHTISVVTYGLILVWSDAAGSRGVGNLQMRNSQSGTNTAAKPGCLTIGANAGEVIALPGTSNLYRGNDAPDANKLTSSFVDLKGI